MQGIWVQALVWVDPTGRRATKSTCHSCWAYALEPASHHYWAHVPTEAHVPRARAPQQEKSPQREATHRNEE